MENKPEYKYILIPLSVIKRIYTHPKTAINDIFDIGIYCLAQKVKTNLISSLGQVLYCYYRAPDELTSLIKARFELMIRKGYFNPDDYYFGFEGEIFNPESEIEEITDYIEKQGDAIFSEAIIEFNKIRSVKSVIDIKYRTSSVIKNIQSLKDYVVKGEPTILVKTDMMFDYLHNTKTQYEKDLFACYLGIRSIIGNKQFAYSTKDYIVCRMIGVKSPKHLNKALKYKKLKAVYDKYSKRYHIDKLLNNLVDKKFIVKLPVPAMRRIYLTTKLDLKGLEDAVFNNLTNNQKSRISSSKEAEKNAANNLLKRLSST